MDRPDLPPRVATSSAVAILVLAVVTLVTLPKETVWLGLGILPLGFAFCIASLLTGVRVRRVGFSEVRSRDLGARVALHRLGSRIVDLQVIGAAITAGSILGMGLLGQLRARGDFAYVLSMAWTALSLAVLAGVSVAIRAAAKRIEIIEQMYGAGSGRFAAP